MTPSLYYSLEPDFHLNCMQDNPLSSLYHKTRYEFIRNELDKTSTEGKKILDVGCGSCDWNVDGKYNVFGVDISEKNLRYAKKSGRLREFYVQNIEDGLSFEDNEFDIVILSEVLEHSGNPQFLLREIVRILKKNGTLILTIPYDTPVTIWYLLFPLQCFIKGDIFGSVYYKNRCGHLNSFGKKEIGKMLLEAGFYKNNINGKNYFNLLVLAEK